MALVPEDRKTDGLMLPMSVRDNLTFAALDRLSRAGVIEPRGRDAGVGRAMVDRLAIKARRPRRCRWARCRAATSRRW